MVRKEGEKEREKRKGVIVGCWDGRKKLRERKLINCRKGGERDGRKVSKPGRKKMKTIMKK